MPKRVALSAAVVGAVGSLVSIVALPWAHYGGTAVPLIRFPGWGVYAGSVLALHACVAWTVLRRAARQPLAMAAVAALSVVAAGSAITLTLAYDDAPALFDGPIPAVVPSIGLGGIVAVLAILVSAGAAAVSADDRRPVAVATSRSQAQ